MTNRIDLVEAGYCVHPEYVVRRNGKWRNMRFPAVCGLIEHPSAGVILFDTGYSQDFFTASRAFPYSLYPRITPVTLTPGDTAAAQLRARGIAPEDVKHVIISHFHADHIAALGDFPRARYVYFATAFEAVRRRRGFRALAAAFLPELLPKDFVARSRALTGDDLRPLPAGYAPFTQGVDLFGDGSLLAVELPGHATGQLGLFVVGRRTSFLIGDASYATSHIESLIGPHPVTSLIAASWSEYGQTMGRLRALHGNRPDIAIIPSHCEEAVARFRAIADAEVAPAETAPLAVGRL